MRKGTIKAAVLAAVFIGAVLIFGRFMNDTNEDLTTEMKEATLPVITMYPVSYTHLTLPTTERV